MRISGCAQDFTLQVRRTECSRPWLRKLSSLPVDGPRK